MIHKSLKKFACAVVADMAVVVDQFLSELDVYFRAFAAILSDPRGRATCRDRHCGANAGNGTIYFEPDAQECVKGLGRILPKHRRVLVIQ